MVDNNSVGVPSCSGSGWIQPVDTPADPDGNPTPASPPAAEVTDAECCGHPMVFCEDELAAVADRALAVFRERAALWELLKEQTRRLRTLREENDTLAEKCEQRTCDVVAIACELDETRERLSVLEEPPATSPPERASFSVGGGRR